MQLKRSFKVIGLTGGIGSGKTTVAQIFEGFGIPYVDADQVARQLREPGQPGALAIQKRFGTTDRLELRDLLSRDAQAKRDLEGILHPLIKIESEKALQTQHERHPEAAFVVYEASLIIEAGRAKDFDELLVVTAPLEDRIARVMNRDQSTKAQALGLILAQMSDEDRLKQASRSLKNEGSLADLKSAVKNLLDQMTRP